MTNNNNCFHLSQTAQILISVILFLLISEYVLERRAVCMTISTKTGGLPQQESRPPVGLSTQDKQAD